MASRKEAFRLAVCRLIAFPALTPAQGVLTPSPPPRNRRSPHLRRTAETMDQ